MSKPETIQWSLDPRESKLALASLHGAYGLPLGMALLCVVGLLVVGASAVLENRLAAVALGVLLALVGGPMSLLYLLPMLKNAEQRPRLFALSEYIRPLPLALASLVGATALVVTVIVGVWSLLLYPVVMAAMLVTASVFTSTGELDPSQRTLRIENPGARPDREIDLDDFVDVRRFEFGSIIAFRLTRDVRYLDNTRWVVVPAAVAPEVERAIENGIAFEPSTEPTESNRTVQLTLVAFGLLFVGVAVSIVLVGRSEIRDVVTLAMLASMVGMFGFLFLALAYRS